MSQVKNIQFFIPAEILDDIFNRFPLPIWGKDYFKILSQIEMAHWHYTDCYEIKDSNLKSFALLEFIENIFRCVPQLEEDVPRLPQIYADWRQYKANLPRNGALIFSEGLTHVLLVKSYWTKTIGFPQGKLEDNEDPIDCATREVQEEIGFDITGLANPDYWVEATINNRVTRLYVIKDVPMSTHFESRTRCEIDEIFWMPIEDLLTTGGQVNWPSRQKVRLNPKKFF